MNSITAENQTTNVQLLNVDARNEKFERNILFFKNNQSVIYNKIVQHQYKYFQLCLNPDRSFNIYDIKKQLLLYPSTQEGISQHFDDVINKMQFDIYPIESFLGNNEWNKYLNDILPLKAKLHQSLFDVGVLKDMFDKQSNTIKADTRKISFLPLLRVHGIGLGNHLLQIIQQYDISCLIINEPEFDLFYTSLYTVPWDEILSFFINDPNRQCLLSTDNFKLSIQAEENLLNDIHPFAYSSKAYLNASNGRDFSGLKSLEDHYDRSHFAKKVAGCYQDQVIGFKNTVLNLKQGSSFYNGKKQNKRTRVFLVGSGPSLNDSIQYLKQHHDNALVIACGSAISALVKNQIIPDIHIWQERHISKEYLLQYADLETYQKIIGVRLNVVDTDIDSLYKHSYILQKANDPGSTILPLKEYPLSYNVNPTVTNCGIALCPIIGAAEVYLFGLDYGSSENRSKTHAEDTFVLAKDDVEKEKLISIKGNFSKTVYANQFFIWSKSNTENEIAYHKHIEWINIGDGAIIEGTEVKRPEDLPQNFKQNISKDKLLSNIKTLFDNNYTLSSIKKKITDEHIPAAQNYLIAMLDCFDTVPQNRCGIMTTISLISKAAAENDEDEYLPKKLFGIEFNVFLHDLYIQISLTQSDEEAIQLYKDFSNILRGHIEEIYQDFLSIAQLINE